MKLEMDDIFFINALDSETGVAAKDCLVEGHTVTFLVRGSDMGRAIGPKGSKIKSLSQKLDRKVELLGFYSEPAEYFRKAMPETEFGEIKKEGNDLVLKVNSTEKRRIFSEPGKFKRIKKIAERNYSIENIKLR